jgi:hypothetical protein
MTESAKRDGDVGARADLRNVADSLHREAKKLPSIAPLRLWLGHLAAGFESEGGIDDATAALLADTGEASGHLQVLAAELRRHNPESPIARELEGIARDLEEARSLHPAGPLLAEAWGNALDATARLSHEPTR